MLNKETKFDNGGLKRNSFCMPQFLFKFSSHYQHMFHLLQNNSKKKHACFEYYTQLPIQARLTMFNTKFVQKQKNHDVLSQ